MTLRKRTLSAALAALVVLAGALPALAQQGRGNYFCDWGPGMMGGSWFGMIFMWLFWGLVILALVGGIRLLFRTGQSGGGQSAPTGQAQDPLTVLKTRYAKGEISKEEFEKIKADIS